MYTITHQMFGYSYSNIHWKQTPWGLVLHSESSLDMLSGLKGVLGSQHTAASCAHWLAWIP